VTTLRCPACKLGDLGDIIDSRMIQGGHVRWRRRKCLACGRRWTTYERPHLKPAPCQHARVVFVLSSHCQACEQPLETETIGMLPGPGTLSSTVEQ
jgi:hypothetical protein